MKIKCAKIIILFWLFGLGCAKYQSNDVLLQIGQYKLTVEDYEALKSNYKGRLTGKQLENKLIKEGYILAYAIENRFDTIDIILKKLRYALYDEISKVDGYIWNIKVKPNLIISSEEIREAYQKREIGYSLDILYFPNIIVKNKFIPTGIPIGSEKQFYSLKQHVSKSKEAKFFFVHDCYPFYPLGAYTNKILSMKKGDILGPLETMSGYYVVHIAGIDSIQQLPYGEEKDKIEKTLLNTLSEEYIWESQKEISSKMDMKFNEQNIQIIAPRYNEQRKEWIETDKSTELMTYRYHDSILSYKVSDLKEYVQCAPLIYGSLSEPDVIKRCMQNYAIYVFLFDEAQKLNIIENRDFLQFKRQFQEKLFLQYYHDLSSQALVPANLKTRYIIKINYLEDYNRKIKI